MFAPRDSLKLKQLLFCLIKMHQICRKVFKNNIFLRILFSAFEFGRGTLSIASQVLPSEIYNPHSVP